MFELRQAVEAYEFPQRQLAECDRQLQIYLATLPARPCTGDDIGQKTAPPTDPGPDRETKRKKNEKTGDPAEMRRSCSTWPTDQRRDLRHTLSEDKQTGAAALVVNRLRAVANLAHLNARDTTLAYASRAPQAAIARLKTRMSWEMPWYTITDNFDKDFGVDEWHGHNVFFRDGERVFRTYFINNRGDEAMGSTWSYLDMTPLGRQETWEDSPDGYPQTPPYKW